MNQSTENTLAFQTKMKIRFRDADPAGIMFFGNILGLTHDVFEEFIDSLGISWQEWFKPVQWACPIRHAEVEYLSPFVPGKTYVAAAQVLKIGQTSFQMQYEFLTKEQKICARVKVVHSFVDQKTFQKADVPQRYRELFSKYQIKTAP